MMSFGEDIIALISTLYAGSDSPDKQAWSIMAYILRVGKEFCYDNQVSLPATRDKTLLSEDCAWLSLSLFLSGRVPP